MNIKTLKFTPKWVVPCVVASLTIPCALGQQADTIQWDGANGNWSDSTWQDVTTTLTRNPIAGDLVGFVAPNAVITVDVNTPILEQLFIRDNFTLEVDEIVDVDGSDAIDNPDPAPDIPATGFFLSDGTVNVNGTGLISVTGGGNFDIASAGVGELNLVAGGEITSAVATVLGRDGGSATFNQTGGTLLHSTSDFKIAGWGADAIWNLSGGTAELTFMRFGFGNSGGTGVINHTGGELTLLGPDNTIGWASFDGSSFTYNLSGTGKLDVADNRLRIGVVGKDAYSNSLLQTGGELTVAGRVDIGEGNDANTGTNLYSISGGIATIAGEIRAGAFGSMTTGTFELSGTGDVEAGGMLVGNGLSGTANVSAGNLTLIGRLRIGSNNGSTATNQFNLTGGTVEVRNRVDLGENGTQTNELNVSGGTLTLDGGDNRMLVGFRNDGTGTFNLSGTGVVDAEQVVLGEDAGDNNITGTMGTVNLNGGTLITRQIKVGNGDTADQTLNLDGGTLMAKTGLISPIVFIDGNITNTNLLAGGVTFDTNGIDSVTTGVMTGPGSVTKTGIGKLEVASVQAYTGNTIVEEGTLVTIEPYLDDFADVVIDASNGAMIDLTHGTTDTIRNLIVDGEPVLPGNYDSDSSFITGGGTLNVTGSGIGTDPEITSITVSGTTATIVITGEPNKDFVCMSSLTLSGFVPIATTPSTVTTDGSGDATFTVDATESSKFYIVEEASAIPF